MLRSRSRYQDLGEKPSKYFFNLENRNYANKVMTKIIEMMVQNIMKRMKF